MPWVRGRGQWFQSKSRGVSKNGKVLTPCCKQLCKKLGSTSSWKARRSRLQKKTPFGLDQSILGSNIGIPATDMRNIQKPSKFPLAVLQFQTINIRSMLGWWPAPFIHFSWALSRGQQHHGKQAFFPPPRLTLGAEQPCFEFWDPAFLRHWACMGHTRFCHHVT